MIKDQLTSVLKHPELVSPSQTDQLGLTLKQYPYFQALHAVHLKGLKLKESFKYNAALKVTAAHTTDRSVLFDYITSASFNQNEISEVIKHNSEHLKALEVDDIDDISVNKSVRIDDALKAHVQATEGVLDPMLFESKDIKGNQHTETTRSEKEPEPSIIAVDVNNIIPEDTLNIGSPLSFDKSESHSFLEWLKITSFKPIVREKGNEEELSETKNNEVGAVPPIEQKLSIIDKFIAENPKIKPIQGKVPKPKLIVEDTNDSDTLMTETLARIYLEQKNYEKAIQSYKILSLKYPEKSSFFANQIKAVEALMEQNKN